MAKTRGLTRKQKAFADKLLGDVKVNGTRAAMEVYGKVDKPVNYGTAASIAYENMNKPQVMKYLHEHAEDAENTMLEVMNYSKDSGRENPSYAAVAVSAAKDVLDRVHGKATQKIETQSTVVTLSLSLTDVT